MLYYCTVSLHIPSAQKRATLTFQIFKFSDLKKKFKKHSDGKYVVFKSVSKKGIKQLKE